MRSHSQNRVRCIGVVVVVIVEEVSKMKLEYDNFSKKKEKTSHSILLNYILLLTSVPHINFSFSNLFFLLLSFF